MLVSSLIEASLRRVGALSSGKRIEICETDRGLACATIHASFVGNCK